MNSMVFIKEAKGLIQKMESAAKMAAGEDKDFQEKQIQHDIDYMFANMTNPSLPSASRLVETAKKYRYAVDSKVIHKVNQFN